MTYSIVKYSEEKHLNQLVNMLEELENNQLYSIRLLNGETLKEWMERSDETYVRYVLTVNNIAVGHVSARKTYPENGLVDRFLKTLTTPENTTIHEMRRLFLHPAFHNKKYGKLLLGTGEKEIMKNNGLPFITVNSKLPAVKFYEKHGWKTLAILQDDIDSNTYWNAMFKNPEIITQHNPQLTTKL